MNKVYKTSVSDWKIIFKNGKEFLFNAATLDEKIETTNRRNEVKITIKKADFDSDFINMCINKNSLEKMEQEFILMEGDSNKASVIGRYKNIYFKPKIISVTDNSFVAGVSTFVFVFLVKRSK